VTATPAAGAALPYSYSLEGTSYPATPYQSSGSFTHLPAGAYHLTIKDNNGRTAVYAFGIQQYCGLPATASSQPAHCENRDGSVTVKVTGGNPPIFYSADGKNYQESNVLSGLAPGNYTLYVIDAFLNTDTLTAAVDHVPCPTMTVASTPSSCTQSTGTITVTSYRGGTAPVVFSIDGVHFQSGQTFDGVAPGNYTVTSRDADNVVITASVTVASDIQLTVDAGTAAPFCSGGSEKLNASSSGADAQFQWSPATGLSDAKSLTPDAHPTVTTEYYLTATIGSCKATDSVEVVVDSLPVADAGSDVRVCYEQNVTLQGKGGTGYSWSPATYLDNPASSSPTVVAPQRSVAYLLMVTDANGCQSAKPDSVSVDVTPKAVVYAGEDTAILAGQSIRLHAGDVNNSGFTNYSWSPTAGLDDPASPDPVAALNGEETYVVTASTPIGCSASDDIRVVVFQQADIYVPNAFTPNGDGYNDVLHAKPVGMREFDYFAVFNRSGQQVFLGHNAGTGWDGSYNGQRQPAGTYVWIAKGIDLNGRPIQHNGTVILIR
jgi:gliding motility-associated-like protein